MKKIHLYITVIFVTLSVTLLIISIRYFNQESVIEKQMFSLIPPNPLRVVHFKNPSELYNQYLTQSNVFKKIDFPQKSAFLRMMRQLDSIYNFLLSRDIGVQDYSYLWAEYSSHQWIFAFAVQRIKDIDKLQSILQKYSLPYKEINGNFFISYDAQILSAISSSHRSNLFLEWMNVFSKNIAPLQIYQKRDTVEMAYQIQFQLQKIMINGFIHYPHFTGYASYQPLNISFDKSQNVLVQQLILNNCWNEADTSYQFLDVLKQNYLSKKIQIADVTIVPIQSYDAVAQILPSLSDSMIKKGDMVVYAVSKQFSKKLSRCLCINEDSTMYMAVNEHNVILSSQLNSIFSQKRFFENDYSHASFYYVSIPDASLQSIQKSIYPYIPLSIQLSKDTVPYHFDAEIFSSFSSQYFSFTMDIEQNPVYIQFLWAYSHPLSIQNIAGLLDDHKTHTHFILIQDTLQHIALISSNGEFLWRYPLKNRIMSDIFNVDILKNNKHQLIFNTNDAIYLIDRHGQDVGRFPLRISSKIVSPISVLDYEHKKNYRIWFSTFDHYTYNYTLDGKLAEQFRPYYFEELIKHAPMYASVGLSDYIVLISANGRVVGISRKGDGRWKLTHQLPDYTLHYQLDVSNSLQKSYLYYCTPYALERVSFTDEHKEVLRWHDSVKDAKFVQSPLTSAIYLAVLHASSFVLYSLKGDKLAVLPIDSAYNEVHICISHQNIYYILTHQQMHCIIQQDVDNNIQIIVDKLHSSVIPYVDHLFKDHHAYLIYAEDTKLYCKKL